MLKSIKKFFTRESNLDYVKGEVDTLIYEKLMYLKRLRDIDEKINKLNLHMGIV